MDPSESTPKYLALLALPFAEVSQPDVRISDEI